VLILYLLLRLWLDNTIGMGEVYADSPPTKDKNCHLKPDPDLVFKYRFLVFNRKNSQDKAEAAWQYFGILQNISEAVCFTRNRLF
jgi:hypothetical protein